MSPSQSATPALRLCEGSGTWLMLAAVRGPGDPAMPGDQEAPCGRGQRGGHEIRREDPIAKVPNLLINMNAHKRTRCRSSVVGQAWHLIDHSHDRLAAVHVERRH